MIDYAKRWNDLSANKQALLALRVGKRKEFSSFMRREPTEKKLVAYVVPAPDTSVASFILSTMGRRSPTLLSCWKIYRCLPTER